MTRIESFVILIIVIILTSIISIRKKIAPDTHVVSSAMFEICLCYILAFKGRYIDYGSSILTLTLGSFISIVLGQGLGSLIEEHVHIAPKDKRDIWYWGHLVILNLIWLFLVLILLIFTL